MLNSIYNVSYSSESKTAFYDKQELFYKKIADKNDEYFYNLIEYLYKAKTIDPKKNEVLPFGNMYFLEKFYETQGTTNNSEQILYFNYLKFLIDSQNDEHRKQIIDPIQTVVRSDSDNFLDDNTLFLREKVLNKHLKK